MRILIAGDFYPGLRLEAAIQKAPIEVFGDFLQLIGKVDLSIANLEAPLTEYKYAITKTGPALKGPTHAASFLKMAGFDLLTLANNHILDYGKNGLEDTLSVLTKSKLSFVGAGMSNATAQRPFTTVIAGKQLSVLNFSENEWSTTHDQRPGANPIDPVSNFWAIREAKNLADKVLVITHGGHEMYPLPSPRMKKLFRFYVEAGADAVVNHHTHCTSGYEVYRGSPIFYSLGNFLFDHLAFRNGIWNKGLSVTLSFEKDKTEFEIHHFDQCNSNAQLSLCNEDEGDKRQNMLYDLNKTIENDEALNEAFEGWVKKQTKQYQAFIEPHKNRYLQALQNRGILPSLWSKRKKLYLLNLIRCEAHHDILQAILEHENSHS